MAIQDTISALTAINFDILARIDMLLNCQTTYVLSFRRSFLNQASKQASTPILILNILSKYASRLPIYPPSVKQEIVKKIELSKPSQRKQYLEKSQFKRAQAHGSFACGH